jgi:hypothetical protein
MWTTPTVQPLMLPDGIIASGRWKGRRSLGRRLHAGTGTSMGVTVALLTYSRLIHASIHAVHRQWRDATALLLGGALGRASAEFTEELLARAAVERSEGEPSLHPDDRRIRNLLRRGDPIVCSGAIGCRIPPDKRLLRDSNTANCSSSRSNR